MTLSRKFLVVIFLVVALCATASFAAGRLVRSPAQVAADAAPPPPSVLTAPVEQGYVTPAIVVRGSLVRGSSVTIDAMASEGAESVVTARPLRVGDRVRPGTVLAEVSYRPIIALSGRIPMIRDLTVGSVGPDVAHLQESIEEVGWAIDDESGTFGPSTAAAVENLYRSVGYEAPKQPAGSIADGQGAPSDESDGNDAAAKARPGASSSPARDYIVARKSELVLINHLPGKVAAISSPVGGRAGDALLTVSTAPPTVRALIAPAQRELVRVGDEVVLSSTSPPYRSRARIVHVGATVQDEQTKAFSVPLKLIPSKTPPDGILDQGIQVRIGLEKHAATGMIVPIAAVYTVSGGDTAVLKVDGGRTEEVAVRVLETGSGRARVVAEEPNALSTGDQVRVGAA